MIPVNNEFMMSTELECLTTISDSEENRGPVFERFIETLSELAPSLPCSSGIFNAYGRVYIDCGHIELAASECSSPYDLPSIVDRQQCLVRQAVAKLQQDGVELLLANNNHSGLLTTDCPTWGAHENYLTELHPKEFGDLILPFLVTRIYAGAGGIEYPTGRFLAATRPLRMEMTTGGGTTESRAIHSTARDEHHMGRNPSRFRYHLIVGDGHRSHFNLALQFAATALALKAVFSDPEIARQATKVGRDLQGSSWVETMRRLHMLAEPGQPPKVERVVIETQRLYLAAAIRYVHQLTNPPSWIPIALGHWEQTLDALEAGNLDWLSAHLDSFAKYRFYTAVLNEQGKSWQQLPNDQTLFNELALLDHSYHSFCDPNSVFDRLEQAGVLRHRLGPCIAPGGEANRFVPSLQTRADARARFIRDHAGNRQYLVDWSMMFDRSDNRCWLLEDPFAESVQETSNPPHSERLGMLLRRRVARP